MVGVGELLVGHMRLLSPPCLCPRFTARHHIQIPRKEVIQPQLPLQLPCYDFVPVTGPALESCLLAVSELASGVTSSHDVTGGVYKARERIHRTMADARLLATPTSCGRVAAHNPNCDRL
jgi:hypothetical protein